MPESGPYIQTALICEKVLQEQDGVLTAVRIIDRTVFTVLANLPEDALPPVPINHTMLICLRSGSAQGSASLHLIMEQPSGLRTPAQVLPVFFEGQDRGVNLILPMQLQLTEAGLYWFELRLDGEFLTRIPFRLLIQRIGATG